MAREIKRAIVPLVVFNSWREGELLKKTPGNLFFTVTRIEALRNV